MHGRQTSYTNRTFNSLQLGVFCGIFERMVDFLRFFCATKVVWTCIHAYGGEWVKTLICHKEYCSEYISVEKPFVAISLRFNHKTPGLMVMCMLLPC